MFRFAWTLALILTAPVLVAVAGINPKVIYGDDNRRELHQISDARVRNLARSSGALMKTKDLRELGPTSYYLEGRTYREEYGLCPTEPFLEQPTTGFCSGVLIAEDLFLTAGHCLGDEADSCAGISIVFDYALANASGNPRIMPKTNVFACKRVLLSKNSELEDYALLVLEKSVKGRMPVPYRRAGKIPLATPLLMIGHPSGLPQKIVDGARVLDYDRTGFSADLDAYYSNSGSPVFNARTFELEGLLIEGEDEDWVKHPVNQCKVTHRCAEAECDGESSGAIDDVLRRELEKWSAR